MAQWTRRTASPPHPGKPRETPARQECVVHPHTDDPRDRRCGVHAPGAIIEGERSPQDVCGRCDRRSPHASDAEPPAAASRSRRARRDDADRRRRDRRAHPHARRPRRQRPRPVRCITSRAPTHPAAARRARRTEMRNDLGDRCSRDVGALRGARRARLDASSSPASADHSAGRRGEGQERHRATSSSSGQRDASHATTRTSPVAAG